MGEILGISLKLNFSPNSLGCYGLTLETAYDDHLTSGQIGLYDQWAFNDNIRFRKCTFLTGTGA